MEESKKSDRWMITLWDFNVASRIKKHLCYMYVVGEEYAPTTGKLHFHLYIEFKKEYNMGSVKKVLGDKTCHCEIAVKEREACVAYCIKGNEEYRKILYLYDNSVDVYNLFDVPDEERSYRRPPDN